jgi:hypothetical protein
MADFGRIASVGGEAITSSGPASRVGLVAFEVLNFYLAPSGNAAAVDAELIVVPAPASRMGLLAFEVIGFVDVDIERLQGLTLQPSADLQGTASLGRPLR